MKDNLISNEISDEKEDDERESGSFLPSFLLGAKFKTAVKKLGLMLFLAFYTSLGALIFQTLEHETDVIHIRNVKNELEKNRRIFMESVANISDNFKYERPESDIEKEQELSDALILYEEAMEHSLEEGVSPVIFQENKELEPRWTFTECMFFSATVLTTIGYGNITPATHWGRVFCIAFALIGIPLTLTVLADMGDMMASMLPTKTLKKILPKQMVSGRLQTISSVIGCFSLLLLFIAIGGGLFYWLEDWRFLDAFYFCFITTTTIGFGDLVPTPSSLSFCGAYILIGLALTSTVIELVRRHYAVPWEQMRLLTSRIQMLSKPLAEAMKKMAETGAGELDLDLNLVKELQELNKSLMEVQKKKDPSHAKKEKEKMEDPWESLLLAAQKKKRITVYMYESSV